MKQLYNQTINEKIFYQELDNGLKVYVMPKKGFTKQFAIFATHFGSNDSKFIIPGEKNVTQVPDGVAHFLEHKMFEEKEGSVFEKFSKLGASANAFTNFTTTAYLFTSTENFYKNLELLIKFVQSPYFTDENVEKEKGIIAQEIRMYDDDPNWQVYFNTLKAMYSELPVRIDIAGSIESISRITKEDLYKCYNTFYHPENMVLFAIGDIDIDKTLDLVNSVSIKGERQGEIQRIYSEEPNIVYQKVIEKYMEVSMPMFNLGFKDLDIGYGTQKLLKKDITTQICLEMLIGRSSNLYEILYKDGLIDTSFDFEYVGEVKYGYSIIGGQSKDPYKIKDVILGNLQKPDILKEEDFYRIKKKYIGKFLRAFNSIEGIAQSFINYYMKDINLLQYVDVLNEITYQNVIDRYMEHFNENNNVISVINPAKN
ncbi:MAG: EF-P 5-aminopentanol modification-associated protein YfmH [Thermoanaerobacteraceae bacterium]